MAVPFDAGILLRKKGLTRTIKFLGSISSKKNRKIQDAQGSIGAHLKKTNIHIK